MARREARDGYLFVTPAALLIGLFGIFPVFYSVVVSLHRWRIRQGPFIGLENFDDALGGIVSPVLLLAGLALVVFGPRLLSHGRSAIHATRMTSRPRHIVEIVAGAMLLGTGLTVLVFALPNLWQEGDEEMLDSLRITIWYSLGTVPIQLLFGLILAVLLDNKFKGKQVFRVIFLLPYIVPTVASAAIFQVLFSLRPESFANELLGLFGVEPLGWLGERTGVFSMAFGWGVEPPETALGTYWAGWAQGPSLALVSIMIFNYWVYIGYYALIYSNGLANIPRQLYEAAEVDGARRLTVIRKITIPLLSPTTYFLTLLGVIGTFKSFSSIYVLRNPATGGATDPMSVYIFFTFFRRSRFGYAAALSLLLFLIVLGLTVVQRRILEKRVHYGE